MKTKKTAVITGGASGIGKAAALRLAADGVLISLVDLNAERLSVAAEEIRLAGGKVLVFHEDITNEQGMARVMQKTAEEAGSIDCVFANGGILGTVSPIEHFTKENWAKTLENNVVGTFVTVKSAIPYMKERGGSIVLTSSVSGSHQFAQEGFSAYSTSKAAIAAFSKMAALELAQYRIRVNAICPGSIDTNIFESMDTSERIKDIHFPLDIPKNAIPLTKKPGQPEQVASLFAFLVSGDASHITGTEVYVDGAETLLKG
ncbi:SDR family oxidoreductase [Domibacillus sp. PGB-M46]|uniref:SDR family oxidoreductase n=1 Tax=Domibacillus sp. PGB-M46 TaxID=2910255 RepID=UPI001F55EF52|nr:SDR family NAD(P)-dependent oxidoreductase [Domibacillus sp. PGB-M46]MCI2252865.1 SDR family oxidoreductase [Domibacillus sp. PGB-M46]